MAIIVYECMHFILVTDANDGKSLRVIDGPFCLLYAVESSHQHQLHPLGTDEQEHRQMHLTG